MVLRKSSLSSVRLSRLVASRPGRAADVELHAADARKIVLGGSKNIPWNSCVAVSSVGGSPGAACGKSRSGFVLSL